MDKSLYFYGAVGSFFIAVIAFLVAGMTGMVFEGGFFAILGLGAGLYCLWKFTSTAEPPQSRITSDVVLQALNTEEFYSSRTVTVDTGFNWASETTKSLYEKICNEYDADLVKQHYTAAIEDLLLRINHRPEDPTVVGLQVIAEAQKLGYKYNSTN